MFGSLLRVEPSARPSHVSGRRSPGQTTGPPGSRSMAPPKRRPRCDRSPSCTRACESSARAATDKQGEDGRDGQHSPRSRHADCGWTKHARGRGQGLWRMSRTSLTSTFRVSRQVSERVGKRPPRSGRLPTRSDLCRDPSLSVVVLSAQPAPGQCHRRWYCPFSRHQVTTRRHRPRPADIEQVVSALSRVKLLLLSSREDKSILGGGWR
jgi:hypothetical protein